MRVAAIQMRSTPTIAENCEAMQTMVRAAAREGARYVQTPEMTGILQKNPKELFAEITDQESDTLVALAAHLAGELNIWLHIGSHAVLAGDGKAANRAFVFSPDGALMATYDKIHMFDVDLDHGESWRESKVYSPGTSSRIVEIDDGLVGLSVCYDLRFPNLYRKQALAGARILTVPAAFTRQTGRAHWHVLLRARAVENGAFVIAAAQGGDHDDGRETFGHSLIVNPWGEVIAEIDGEKPGFVVADLDLGEVASARNKIPNLANGRDFVLESSAVSPGEVA